MSLSISVNKLLARELAEKAIFLAKQKSYVKEKEVIYNAHEWRTSWNSKVPKFLALSLDHGSIKKSLEFWGGYEFYDYAHVENICADIMFACDNTTSGTIAMDTYVLKSLKRWANGEE